ncbi:SBBP repeat-containing protein, partial [Klebsiella pneumoniae]|uniref:SBBP repeat-containing protein n=1 Tax=Klebsiella pneumoniae TaxID=573 RepID=UPI003013B64F
VATDGAGDTFVAGFLNGQTEFGTTWVSPKGGQDGFVVKYSPSGAVDWVADFGGAGATTQVNGIAVDSSGNVCTTGFFQGSKVQFGST